MTARPQAGFTLTELMMACAVIAIALTLGASAFAHYWKVRSLHGGVDQVVSELRSTQQAAISESHPWVHGVWFKPGSPRWGAVRANVQTGACTVTSRRSFDAGVTVEAASFDDVTTEGLTSNCTAAAEAGSEVAFFYARGTATAGSVSLRHPQVSGGARTVAVSPLTGKVTKS